MNLNFVIRTPFKMNYKNILVLCVIILLPISGYGQPVPPSTLTFSSKTSSGFTAAWNVVSGAAAYSIYVANNPSFNGVTTYTQTSTTKVVTGLASSTTYYVKIKTHSSTGTSGYSQTWTVTTNAGTPTAPTGVAVSNNSPTAITISWQPVSGATTYVVEVANSSSFSNPVYADFTLENNKTVSNLNPATQYYYRVKACNNSGCSAHVVGMIYTLTLPPIALAASDISMNSFRMNWAPVTGVSVYSLDVSTESDFSSFVTGFNGKSVTGTSVVVSGIQPNGIYYYRLRARNSIYILSEYSNIVTVNDFNRNYIRSVQTLVPSITDIESLPDDQKIVKLDFFDGLGRPEQIVMVKNSPQLKDIVQPIAYDAFGREAVKYLPYVSEEENGWFKNNFVAKGAAGYTTSDQYNFYNNASTTIAQDTKPYAETIFEPSPLNRAVKQFGAGADWHANNKHIGMEYLINNSTTEDVIAWDINASNMPVHHAVVANHVLANGYYANGQLFVNVTKDEQGNAVREYTNKSGQVVLKKVQAVASPALNNYTHWASTYYVYDDFGDLRFVLPPELTKTIHGGTGNPSQANLDTWAFQYKYDGRKRMIEKKVPGAGWVYMVYDKRDRLVLTQDANQRAKKEWSFIKYDQLNRPVMTGIYTHTDSIGQEQMSELISTTQFAEQYDENQPHGYTTGIFPNTNLTVHTVTYYDNYDFKNDLIAGTSYDFKNAHLSGQETSAFDRLKGLVTGTKVNVLGSDDYLWSVSYYDDRYRVVQSVVQNHKDSLDRITNVYDFTGNVLKTKTTHSTATVTTDITRTLVYDHALRPLETWHRVDNEDPVLLVKNEYNELGEVITKKLHSEDEGTNFKQHVDYRFNIRGWLTSINDPAVNPNGLFNFQLKYNDPVANGGTAQYNGNISQAIWKTAGNDETSYGYYYDVMNRITEAKYYNHIRPTENNRYNEVIKDGSSSGYDLNGNIKKLQRNGQLTATTFGLMDNLSYTYTGNRLARVDDAIATQTHEKGFKELVKTANEYTYDANGNMVKDDNKGITVIKYNYLNLPATVKKSGADSVQYVYDATGRKLRQIVYGAAPKTTDYAGGFIYENDTLRFINHEEGRILPDTSSTAEHPWEYQYYLKDHLGNVRVTFSEKTATTEYKASLEDATQTEEQSTFANYSRSGINAPVAYNHTPDGAYSQLLHGGHNSQVGLAKSFEVGPGDIFDIEVYAKYQNLTSTPSQYSALFSALVGAFSLNPVGGIGLDGPQAHSAFEGMFSDGPFIDAYLDDDDTAPKAYLNYILFDGDFNLEDFGFDQIDATADQSAIHGYLSLHVKVKKKGYLYIYLSNEDPMQVDVFFDDLRIVHHSAIEQSNDYYPFGLTFNSYSRENSTPNDYKYNGKEEQTELDLGWMDYGARMYLPEIGRFGVQDRFAEIYSSLTPYHYGGNNPMLFIDVNGDSLMTAFSSARAMISFARQVLESMDGSNSVTLTFTSTGSKNDDGDEYLNVTMKGGDAKGTFYRGLKGVIDSDEAVKINVTYGDRNTHTGNYNTSTIDMADVEKWSPFDHSKSEQLGATRAGKLIHEIREQYNKVLSNDVNNTKYEVNHNGRGSGSAIHWENLVNGNTRGPTITDNIVIQQYRLKNGSVVKYEILGTGMDGNASTPVITIKPYNKNRGIKSIKK